MTPPGLTVAGLPVIVATHPRARRISLRLCAASRTLKLTVPPRASRARALAFLQEQEGWARRAAARLPPAIPFAPGLLLPVDGAGLRLVSGTGRHAVRVGDVLLVPGAGPQFAARVRCWLQAEAQSRLESETRALAETIGRPVRAVSVSDFRSRWGRCTADGRIAYSWRLILAPPGVRRAVVAHEVAHLAQPNHGRAFWALAQALLGASHEASRAWLREHGPALYGYGVEDPPPAGRGPLHPPGCKAGVIPTRR